MGVDIAYSDVKYAEALIGPHTVNTLPLETLTAFRDHGRPALRLEQNVDEAEAVVEELREAGISLDEVAEQLEREGVRKFIEPFDKLRDTLARRAVQPAALAR